MLERAIGYPASGWLPKEWIWYRQTGLAQRAECCGIFRGCAVGFINYYADLAARLLNDPRNRTGLKTLREKAGHMILIEQYLLTACLQYHRHRAGSPFSEVEIGYVFKSIAEVYRPENATAAGFTHLAAGAKRNPHVARAMERRVRQDLPEHYARCERLRRGVVSQAFVA